MASKSNWNQNVWQNHYNKDYSFLQIPDENVVRYFQKQDNLQKKTVLDLGAGSCRNSFFLSNLCKSVVAQDYVPSVIEKAKKFHQQSNSLKSNISFISASATNLPHKDNTFDFILFWGVLHYIHPHLVKKTILELQRVLKPNGQLLASIRSTKDTHAKKVVQKQDLQNGSISYYTKRKIKKTFSMFQNISFGFTSRIPIADTKRIAHHIVEVSNC